MMDPIRIRVASDGYSKEFQAYIHRSSGRWAKWRMGTVNKIARNLARVLLELVLVFDTNDYKTVKDCSWFSKVVQAIQSPDFALDHFVVRHIAKENEQARGFARGCPCHPESCMQAIAAKWGVRSSARIT